MAVVLVVDDEPDVLLLLRVNLEIEGHQVLLAGDGEVGLEKTRAEEPDLVLLDAMMPVMDGWSVLEALQGGGPPVVVVSAKAQPADVLRALELGAVDFVAKPFSLDNLLGLVRDLVDAEPEDVRVHRSERIASLQAGRV